MPQKVQIEEPDKSPRNVDVPPLMSPSEAASSLKYLPPANPNPSPLETLPRGGGIPRPPGSIGDTGLGGMADILSILQSVSGGVTNEDIIKALSPQIQAAPQQMPAYFTRELPQPGQLVQDTTPQVGAGNASAQGIGNAINASIHALASFKAARDKNVQMAQAEKVGRFMQNQEGIDQANEILRTYPPGSPEAVRAQQVIDTNTAHRDEMLSDKKFEKLIEKGFNVSLTDPSQNKTPEHGIVQKGIDLFRFKKQAQQRAHNRQPLTPQQAAAAGQRFEASRPQMMGPNKYALQKLQLQEALGKNQNLLASRILPNLLSTAARNKQIEFVQRHADWRAANSQEGSNARTWANILKDINIAAGRVDAASNIALQRSRSQLFNVETVLTDKLTNPAILSASRDKFSQAMDRDIQAQEALISVLTAARDAEHKRVGLGKKAEDYPELMNANQKIYQAEQDLDKMRKAKDAGILEYNEEIKGRASLHGTAGAGSATSGAGTAGVDLGGTPEPDISTQLLNAGSLADIYAAIYGGTEEDVTQSVSGEPSESETEGEPNPQ